MGVGVHRAARICDAARGGQILVSNATAGIVEDAELTEVELLDLGEHRLKGLPRAQRLFQLSVLALPSTFDPPRTAELDRQVPGVGTFFFSDLLGFGQVIRSVGDEATAALVTDYQRCVAKEVDATSGIVLEQAGDHVRAVFRNASDAIQAAVAVREALSEFFRPPGCDVAVGIVLHSARWSGDPRDPRAGTAMLRVTRLGDTVERAQVLVSQTTAALLEGDPNVPALRSLGERTFSDIAEPMRLYELIDST